MKLALLLTLLTTSALAQVPTTGGGGGAPGGGAATPMVTPIMTGIAAGAPLTTGTSFNGPVSGPAWNATKVVREWFMPFAATINDLTENLQSTFTAGSYAFDVLNVTQSTSAGYTCALSFTGPVNYCTFHATTSPSPLSFAAGEQFTIQSTETSAALTSTNGSSLSFTITNSAGHSAVFGGGVNGVAGATDYIGWGIGGTYGGTETTVSSIVGASGTIKNFYMWASAAAGAAKSWQATVFYDGVATSGPITCTAANTTSCSDLVNSQAVVAGHTWSIQVIGTAANAVATLNFSIEFDPTTAGQAMVMGSQGTIPSTVTAKFGMLNGTITNSATESGLQIVAPTPLTVKTVLSAMDTAAPTGTCAGSTNCQRITFLRACTAAANASTCTSAAASPNPQVAVTSGAGPGGSGTAAYGADVSGNLFPVTSVTVADLLDWETCQVSVSAALNSCTTTGGANSVATYYKWTAIVTAP